MAEYAVILGVITPAVVIAFATLGDAIIPMIERVIDYLS
jgi:Flp pilus assembly pilin Flp